MSVDSIGYKEPEKKEILKPLEKSKSLEELSELFSTDSVLEHIKKAYIETKADELRVKQNISAEYHNWLTDLGNNTENQLYKCSIETKETDKYYSLQFGEVMGKCFWKNCLDPKTTEKEYIKLQSWPDFNINDLKNSELWLKTPLLDPLDIILLFAAFGEILWKIGLKVLAKGCSLLFKGGKLLIKTTTWEELELSGKVARKIFEKYKDKLKGLSESIEDIFEPATTNWIKVPGKTDKMRNAARAVSTGEWADYVETAFNKLLNKMILRNADGELIGNKEFLWKIEDLATDLNPKDFLDLKKLPAFNEVFDRIEDFIVNKWSEIAADRVLQKDVQIALRKISDTMNKAWSLANLEINKATVNFTTNNISKLRWLYKLIWL